MPTRSVKPDEIAVDPMFSIPDGVTELTYSDTPSVDAEEIEQDFSTEPTSGEASIDSVEAVSSDIEYGEVPETPQILGVESPQTIHTNLAGVEVVDAILDVSDVSGVVQYEMRITKI